ncbi:MAG TPA: 50S ribosomal protein L25 [Candidatus Paceibacterota bacterium]|nr:50S ribosomal protein L25 [Candidatus Paceibacterota bacterium]HPT17803.1 50S ribosomal protein L25 [Candidatus Paceibacterota bacterium]
MLSLTAKIRDIKEKLDMLRKAGELPAVLYGAGTESTPITVSLVEFKKVWHKAGESSTVKITAGKTVVDTLIHEVQQDPVSDEPIHVDFLVIDMNKKIKVEVPLEFIGESSVVKSGLGTLVKVLYEVEVEALPKDLPHVFNIDISKLVELNSQILVSDIVLPKGVTMITKETEVIAAVTEQKEEKEEVAPVDLSAIEVEKKGKKEEEGAEAVENTATI